MALIANGREDDEVTEFLNIVLDSYKNGNCTRDDARNALWQVLDAAVKQREGFMGQVRGFSQMFLRNT